MQDIVTNMRGNRAFNLATGKVIPFALAASALLASAPGIAAPVRVASSATLPAAHRSVKVLTEAGTPADVTLDFVAADITDVLKALSLETHTNIVSGPDVKGAVTVSLANVSLEDALNMISRLSGFQYAKIGNTYVVGTPASLVSLTGGDDQAMTQTAVIRYLYSNGDDLTTVIKQILPNLSITTGKGTTGSGGVFIMTGTAADIAQAKQVVDQSESALSKGLADDQTVVYNIKYDAADDLVNVLTRLVPNLIVTPGPSQRLPPVAPSTADASGITSTTTSYGATGTGSSVSGAGGATGATTAGGTVTSVTGNLPLKPTTDSLLLSGTADDIARAQQILAEVDTRPAQIEFDAKITDLDTNLARDLGLGYSFAGAQTTIGQVTPAGATASTTQYTKSLPFGYTPLSQFVNVQLYADQAKGDARILASPNISAVDGQPAAIFIGDDITYVSSITASTTGQNITTATASAGVKLFITGKVDNDGYITVNLHPEVSTVTFQAAAGGAKLPDISTREATTTLRVRNGDYIALGGLAENQDSRTINSVPILGDIPILGNLFRYDSRQRDQRELAIFIRVSIQKDGAVAAIPTGPQQ